MGKADSKVKGLDVPLTTYLDILQILESTLPLLQGLDQFVDIITRSSFCALREEKREYYERTQDIINILIAKVSFSATLIEDIRNPLSILSSFKSDVQKLIMNPINDVLKILEPIFSVMSELDFLKTIASFKVYIPVGVSIEWALFLPYITLKFRSVGLEELGAIVKKVIDFIKSIPLIGELVSAVENIIDRVLNGIFKAIGVDLPDFGLDLPFIDEFRRKIEELLALSDQFVDYLNNIMSLDGRLTGLIEPIIEPILDAIPTVDIGCSDGNETEIFQCTLDSLGMNVNFDIDGISGLNLNGLNLLPDTGILDIVREFLEDAKNIGDQLLSLFEDSAVKCAKYETVSLDILEQLGTPIINNISDFPVPMCPMNFEICTDLVLPKADDVANYVSNKLSSAFARKNRVLETRSDGSPRTLLDYGSCGKKWDFGNTTEYVDWGVSITFPLQKEVKLPFLSDRTQALLNNLFDVNYYRGLSWRFSGGMKRISNVKFLLGCEDGEFQFYLETLPLLEVDINRRFLESKKSEEYQHFSEENQNKHKSKWEFPSNFGPMTKFRPTPDAVRTLKYLQGTEPDLIKFQKEIDMVGILNKILCHLDYLFVNEKIGVESVLTPNDSIFQEWLRFYKSDFYRSSGPFQLPAQSSTEAIVSRLGKDTNKIQDWKDKERLLSKRQEKAYRMRASFQKKREKLGLPFYELFPADNLGRQKICRDVYGYNVSKPPSWNSKDFITDSLLTLAYHPTQFYKARFGSRASTLQYRKKRRTINFGLTDSHGNAFDLMFTIQQMLINNGYNFLVIFVDSSLQAVANLIIKALEPIFDTNNSTSTGNELDQYALEKLQLLIKAIPAIVLSELKDLGKKVYNTLFGNVLLPVTKRQLNSVFDIVGLGIENNRALAEQEVAEFQLATALTTSINLMRNDPNEEGWDGSLNPKSRYCKDRFCIYLWPKDPLFTEQCYPGMNGVCPYKRIFFPEGV